MQQLDLFTQPDAAKRIEEHWKSMRTCWPLWEGPRVEDSIHGRCSVDTPIVFNLTHGHESYHYMAPCIIESISADGSTIIAAIDYAPDSPCAHLNGQRLRLGILDLWPPVSAFNALRQTRPPISSPR